MSDRECEVALDQLLEILRTAGFTRLAMDIEARGALGEVSYRQLPLAPTLSQPRTDRSASAPRGKTDASDESGEHAPYVRAAYVRDRTARERLVLALRAVRAETAGAAELQADVLRS